MIRLGHSQGIDYAIVDPSSLRLAYTIGAAWHLSGVLKIPEDFQPTQTLELHQTVFPVVRRANGLIAEYVENSRKIAGHFGLTVEGEGIACCRNFKRLIECQELDHFEELDLSGLGLDCLPFHIGLFRNLKRLNLSDNKLRVLPRDVEVLESLEEIDLQGNPFVCLPDWIQAMNNGRLRILWQNKRCKTEELAQSQFQSQSSQTDP